MFVIWLTGLPCSGKTTIAKELAKRIPNMTVLDGDYLRSWLSQEDFSREGRIRHNRRVATLAKMLVDQDIPVCVSLVSPYEQNRKDARQIVDNDRFLEVYTKCPVEVCERRDVKGMYRKAREGQIANFTGIDDPYEEPNLPDVVVDTSTDSLDECIEKVMLHCSKWLKPFVIMTGYQRSGTSFLARAMNLCGVYLGPREKITRTELGRPSDNLSKIWSWNIRGIWENEDFRHILHGRIFPKRDRRDFSNLPEDILETPSLSETDIVAVKEVVTKLLIHSSMASGLKHPSSLVIKAILPYLPTNTIIVAIFRHPLRVVDSMLRGRGVPKVMWNKLRPRFLNLWRANNKALLDILDTRPSFLLNFDWPKKRMLNEISIIVNKLGLIDTDLTSWYTEEIKQSDNHVDTNTFPDSELKEIHERLLLRSEQNHNVVVRPYYQPKVELRGVISNLEKEITVLSEAVYKLSYNSHPQTRPKSRISNLMKYVSVRIRG